MKCNLIYKFPIWAIRLLGTMCLLLAVITPLQAANVVESNETKPAVGRMPVLLNAPNLPVGPIATGATEPVSDKAIVGVPLTLADMGIDFGAHVLANFSDADSDKEGGSFYEWLIDGVVVGSSTTFTPEVAHGGQLLSVRVTPKTSNGDPSLGNAIESNKIVVRSALINRFTTPDLIMRNWSDAKAYCEVTVGNGYSLPSKEQLVQLYEESTSAIGMGNNVQMCDRYGWPMRDVCGGKYVYWTKDEKDGEPNVHYVVLMYSSSFGIHYEDSLNIVTCIR